MKIEYGGGERIRDISKDWTSAKHVLEMMASLVGVKYRVCMVGKLLHKSRMQTTLTSSQGS